MGKIAVLKAPTGGGSDIVSMLFDSFEDGVDFVSEKLGFQPNESLTENGLKSSVWNIRLEDHHANPNDPTSNIWVRKSNEEIEEMYQLALQFFTEYDYGNISVFKIIVSEQETGKPFNAFSI